MCNLAFGLCTLLCDIASIDVRPTRNGRTMFAVHSKTQVNHLDLVSNIDFCEGLYFHEERLLRPKWCWSMSSTNEQQRFIRNLGRLIYSIAFSEYGGFEVIMMCWLCLVRNSLGIAFPFIRSRESCDKCSSRREILRSHFPRHRAWHVTYDVRY